MRPTEPLTAILVGLGVKAGSNMIDGLTRWLQQGQHEDSLHLVPGGEMERYSGGLRAEFYYTPMVEVVVEFATTDASLAEYIDSDNPALLLVATPDPSGEPVVDVLPCSVTDSFRLSLPTGEVTIAVLVFDDELLDADGDPVLVAWQITEAEFYSDDYLEIDIRFDPDFIRMVDLPVGVPVCDECWLEDDIVTSSWRVTKKGNLNVCGTNNDFHECIRGQNDEFRPTAKGNYRCLNCDKKVVPQRGAFDALPTGLSQFSPQTRHVVGPSRGHPMTTQWSFWDSFQT